MAPIEKPSKTTRGYIDEYTEKEVYLLGETFRCSKD
jgi:hypothetical protein